MIAVFQMKYKFRIYRHYTKNPYFLVWTNLNNIFHITSICNANWKVKRCLNYCISETVLKKNKPWGPDVSSNYDNEGIPDIYSIVGMWENGKRRIYLLPLYPSLALNNANGCKNQGSLILWSLLWLFMGILVRRYCQRNSSIIGSFVNLPGSTHLSLLCSVLGLPVSWAAPFPAWPVS